MRVRPGSATLKKLENTSITINSQSFRLTRHIAERYHEALHERKVFFEGLRVASGDPAVVKLRVQLNPALVERPRDRPVKIDWAKDVFCKEYRALQDCEDIGFTPLFYGSEELRQGWEYEFPGGYLNVIAMLRVPGSVTLDMEDLTENEQLLIKRQLTVILENIRLRGWEFLDPSPDKVLFDRDAGQTYLGGLGGIDEVNQAYTEPITESSTVVWMFGTNIWRW
ncbi:hypothetical protein VTN77DRAFT_2070 [Rasamsonia byssochlamydoides]|uniref:uncharacterized protein n=1 Tax=Rasamsonia byssochlamydoides TaxID=89139 RepID=UPI0037421C0B